jgi:hypothetical protein
MTEEVPLVTRKNMNMLQLLAAFAMLFSLMGGDNDLFTGAIFLMFLLKTMAMFLYEDTKEAIFAAVYLGFFVAFFFDLF